MRKLVHTALTFATIVAATSFASAADLQRPAYKAQPSHAPIYSWAGLYIGIVGGGVWGDSGHTPGAASFSTDGYQIGGTVGYNWQNGRWVYGIEGDLSYSTNKGSIGTVQTSEDYALTIRGRLGYAWTERLMIYGTGGYAGANVKAAIPALSEEQFRNGSTLGLGLEYAVLPRWTVKGEYLYVDYMDENYFSGSAFARNVSLTNNLFRLGLNYKF